MTHVGRPEAEATGGEAPAEVQSHRERGGALGRAESDSATHVGRSRGRPPAPGQHAEGSGPKSDRNRERAERSDALSRTARPTWVGREARTKATRGDAPAKSDRNRERAERSDALSRTARSSWVGREAPSQHAARVWSKSDRNGERAERSDTLRANRGPRGSARDTRGDGSAEVRWQRRAGGALGRTEADRATTWVGPEATARVRPRSDRNRERAERSDALRWTARPTWVGGKTALATKATASGPEDQRGSDLPEARDPTWSTWRDGDATPGIASLVTSVGADC
jgi:hypothetical protein